jgi:steroid delta-isomerase-like uncharacterized protein
VAEPERHPALTPLSGFLRAWSGRDASAFAAVCDPGLHYEDPLTPAPLNGPAALGEHAGQLWEAFPDVTVDFAGEPTAAPHAVAAPVRLEGTHGSALAGLPATGRRVTLHGVFWVEPAGDGRLLRVRAFFDLYDAAVQLGVLPSRGGLGERALLILQGFGLRVRERS